MPQAVEALHTAFELGEDAIRKEEPTGTEHRPTVSPARADPYPLGMSPKGEYRVGVAGATGAVGSTILEVLAERKFPVGRGRAARLGTIRGQQGEVRGMRSSRSRS